MARMSLDEDEPSLLEIKFAGDSRMHHLPRKSVNSEKCCRDFMSPSFWRLPCGLIPEFMDDIQSFIWCSPLLYTGIISELMIACADSLLRRLIQTQMVMLHLTDKGMVDETSVQLDLFFYMSGSEDLFLSHSLFARKPNVSGNKLRVTPTQNRPLTACSHRSEIVNNVVRTPSANVLVTIEFKNYLPFMCNEKNLGRMRGRRRRGSLLQVFPC